MLGWLYTFHISHFACINTPRNMKHSLYIFCISCELRVLLMPRKNKPWNPSTFCANVDTGTKCEKRKKGCEMWKKWHKIPRFQFFFFAFHNRFCVFCDKCIVDLKERSTTYLLSCQLNARYTENDCQLNTNRRFAKKSVVSVSLHRDVSSNVKSYNLHEIVYNFPKILLIFKNFFKLSSKFWFLFWKIYSNFPQKFPKIP